jgi:hypothetical protein
MEMTLTSVRFTSDNKALVETSIRGELQNQLGGVAEEYIPLVGRIDLSLPDLIIEVKNVNEWMHGALARTTNGAFSVDVLNHICQNKNSSTCLDT